MKIIKKLIILFFVVIVAHLFSSCSEEEDEFTKLQNQENLLELKLYSNTPGAHMVIQGPNLIVKDYWEDKGFTKNSIVTFLVTCKDRNVLMTGEMYVNGKLVRRAQANGRLNMFYRLKK